MKLASPGRLDRWILEKSILEKSQGAIKPWEIGQLTLSEALMFLEDPSGRAGSAPTLSDREIEAELERWQGMTPLERLRNFVR